MKMKKVKSIVVEENDKKDHGEEGLSNNPTKIGNDPKVIALKRGKRSHHRPSTSLMTVPLNPRFSKQEQT